MNNFDLTNKVAIVTGGSQGFGLAIVKRFLDSGAKVIIWDIDEEESKKTIDTINSGNLIFQKVNITDYKSIEKNLSEVEEKFDKIDIFINNAGIAGPISRLEDYPNDQWKKVIITRGNFNNIYIQFLKNFE